MERDRRLFRLLEKWKDGIGEKKKNGIYSRGFTQLVATGLR